MKVFIGLGNPGAKYQATRHNVGYMVLDHLATLNQVSFKTELKFQAEIAEYFVNQEKIILVKPLTYMNLSGDAVVKIRNYYQVDLTDLVIIYDDLDLPLGSLRLREKGSAGSHNGMSDIIKVLKTNQLLRIRIGIGAPDFESRKSFVLGKFNPKETLIMVKTIDKAAQALSYFVSHDFVKTMSEYNEINNNE